MEQVKITEHRTHAENFSAHSEATSDAVSKLHSLAMTEGWQLLVDSFGTKDANGHVKQ